MFTFDCIAFSKYLFSSRWKLWYLCHFCPCKFSLTQFTVSWWEAENITVTGHKHIASCSSQAWKDTIKFNRQTVRMLVYGTGTKNLWVSNYPIIFWLQKQPLILLVIICPPVPALKQTAQRPVKANQWKSGQAYKGQFAELTKTRQKQAMASK